MPLHNLHSRLSRSPSRGSKTLARSAKNSPKKSPKNIPKKHPTNSPKRHNVRNDSTCFRYENRPRFGGALAQLYHDAQDAQYRPAQKLSLAEQKEIETRRREKSEADRRLHEALVAETNERDAPRIAAIKAAQEVERKAREVEEAKQEESRRIMRERIAMATLIRAKVFENHEYTTSDGRMLKGVPAAVEEMKNHNQTTWNEAYPSIPTPGLDAFKWVKYGTDGGML
jgi:hypothetical protein